MDGRSASRGILGPLAVWLLVVLALAVGALLVVRGLNDDGDDRAGAEPTTCAELPADKRAACERARRYRCGEGSPAPARAAIAPARGRRPPRFEVGLVMRTCDGNDAAADAVLHPRLVRFEMDATKPSSGDRWIDFYASLGATPQPLANFYGRVPSDAQIDALAAWARSKSATIRLIELGNEDSYTHKYGDAPTDASYRDRARAYGAAARRLGKALAGSGVGVLVQADDGGTESPTWVDEMYAAAPDLHQWVAGWVLHPYGRDYMARLARLEAQVGRHGGAGPRVYCTELGLATDDGRELSDNYGWSADMTYRQAGDTLHAIVTDLEASDDVAQVILYQSTDQRASGASTERERYFGLVQADGITPKGALTRTAIRLLAD